MSDLAGFLLARITEDEAGARKWVHHAQQNDLIVRDPKYLGMFMPGWHQWRDIEAFASRVLTECEAKRRIVARPWTDGEPVGDGESDWLYGIHAAAHHKVLRLLALPYRDHPDYRSEWAP